MYKRKNVISMVLSLHIANIGSVTENDHEVKIGIDLGTKHFITHVWDEKTCINPESAYEILTTDMGKRSFPY